MLIVSAQKRKKLLRAYIIQLASDARVVSFKNIEPATPLKDFVDEEEVINN